MSYVVKHVIDGSYLSCIVDVDSGQISDFREPNRKCAIRFGRKDAANEVCEALARHWHVAFKVVKLKAKVSLLPGEGSDG